MGLTNCKRCGKLFNLQGHTVCSNCRAKDADDFSKIWEYMSTHPGVTILELSRETGVEPSVITRFLREGRLTTDSRESGDLLCESCGSPINEGRYCNKCAQQLRGELMKASKGLSNRAEVKRQGKAHPYDSFSKRR